MKRASYYEGIAWIALNDEAAETDASVIADLISVVMLAELFGVSPDRVARDVVRYRKAQVALAS